MTRVQDIYPENRVSLREVGLRDGLQLVKSFPSTAAKQRWVREEYAAGVRHFEVGSFLPAKTSPQFVDVRDVADLHIRAMTHPAARSERFLAVSGDFMSMLEIAKVLKARMGPSAKRVP